MCFFFFFNDTATTEIYTLSLHDALPISVIVKPQGVERRGAGVRDLGGDFVRQSLREHILDLLPLAVLFVPLGLVRRDAMLAVGLAERQLDDGQDLKGVVADQSDVQLPAFDQLLDDRRLVELLMNELHPHSEVLVVLHHRSLRDAHGSVLQERLHDEWKPQLRRTDGDRKSTRLNSSHSQISY